MGSYKEIDRCRICKNEDLSPVLSLGRQALTGVFPKTRDQKVTAGPVDLIRCDESRRKDACGLVQLKQSYDKAEMYGSNYGYHSGLNKSMVAHLHDRVRTLLSIVPVEPGDLAIDIGSNDGTLLRGYPKEGLRLVGIDPTGRQFQKYYPSHIELVPDFFSAKAVLDRFDGKKAKIATSIAMFYDLDSPVQFMEQVRDVLADDGVWVLEQSYMPTMIERNAYDTICHEHLEYYRLKQIQWMAERVGLKIIDVELNDINGGSFAVTVTKSGSSYRPNVDAIDKIVRLESAFAASAPYEAFAKSVSRHRDELKTFFTKTRAKGRKIIGYGASTKGNVILQYCGFTVEDISCIGEVNEEKFSCFTPGTLIPIVSEEEAKARRPDYLMVLPWHFKEFILKKESGYMKSGGRLFFPLPQLEIH